MNRIPCFSFKLASLLQRTQSYATRRFRLPEHNSPIEQKLRLKDNLPEDYELIYRAPMESYLRAVKIASTVTVSFIAAYSAGKLLLDTNYITLPNETVWNGLLAYESDLWFYLAGFMAINIAVRWFIATYALRVYKNPNGYASVYGAGLPFQKSVNYFEKGQVTNLSHKLNPWKHITFRLGKRPSLLLFHYFRTPSEFHEMCGLQRKE